MGTASSGRAETAKRKGFGFGTRNAKVDAIDRRTYGTSQPSRARRQDRYGTITTMPIAEKTPPPHHQQSLNVLLLFYFYRTYRTALYFSILEC
jgi:hypothetical protein